MNIRIGLGYDAHRLKKGLRLILGGVEIPFESGLLGHSDADVLSHAVMDALLGAAALGDIGRYFPDTDPKYLGADSIKLMIEVKKILFAKGFKPVNVDSTIICEKPKLVDYNLKMRKNIADALGLDLNCVSVKATTQEGMGFCGRKEGIAAHAICIIEKTKNDEEVQS